MRRLLHIPSATMVERVSVYADCSDSGWCGGGGVVDRGGKESRTCVDCEQGLALLYSFARSSIYWTESGVLVISNRPNRFGSKHASEYIDVLPEQFTIIEMEE